MGLKSVYKKVRSQLLEYLTLSHQSL